jgi:DNA-binding NarL/FixJ family response regulator
MITLVLIDAQPLVRAGLRTLLERDSDLSVIGEAENGRSGIELVRKTKPNIVLMDIRMPVMDGLAATRVIMGDTELSDVKIIMLTTFDEDQQIEEAIRIGAAGYLLKDITPDDLRRAVHIVADGAALLAPAITRRVMQRFTDISSRANPHLLAELTEREREVLHQIGLGESNDEIAQSLIISPATARTYVSRLLAKLGARDRSQLVIIAYESGLIRPGKP